jgi:hypothetical protein
MACGIVGLIIKEAGDHRRKHDADMPVLKTSTRRTGYAIASVIFLCVAVGAFQAGGALRQALSGALTKTVPLPDALLSGNNDGKSAVYILGGNQDSLREKFATVSELHFADRAGKILVLSRPGITEYDRQLRRNLTNDEWALQELAKRGIVTQQVELVPLEEEFFGTLTEAGGISRLARERGYRRLILITSRYHTARTWLAFSKYIQDDSMLAIYAAHDDSSLAGLVAEYIKLLIYKHIVLKFA